MTPENRPLPCPFCDGDGYNGEETAGWWRHCALKLAEKIPADCVVLPESRANQALAVAKDALYHSAPGTAGEREAQSLIAWLSGTEANPAADALQARLGDPR